MKGFRVGLVGALAAVCCAEVQQATQSCSGEACKISAEDTYMDNMLASMHADELSVHLLQRKAAENVGAIGNETSGSMCKWSCLSNGKPWRKKCKKAKCSACDECQFQSGPYVLSGNGECRGSKEADDAWHLTRGRYPLQFGVRSVTRADGQPLSPSVHPWKMPDEKVFYKQPSSRLQVASFLTVSSTCAQICDSMSICKAYEITMRGCEYVKAGRQIESGVNCEYAYGGECYCWHSASCTIVTDYKTYANSEYAAQGGLGMGWGASKTFTTSLGEISVSTMCGGCGDSCCDAETKFGGKKSINYPRSGYFCFAKNSHWQEGESLLEDDADEDESGDIHGHEEGFWPVSALVTQMCANGSILTAAAAGPDQPFC